MTEGFCVDADAIRAHAAYLADMASRFDALRTASAHIRNSDDAYGLLCSWIPAVLEGRHQGVDELIEDAAGNLEVNAEALYEAAAAYDDADGATASEINAIRDGF